MLPLDFVHAWEEVAPKLQSILDRRGVTEAEDIVQETGLRAFVHVAEIEDAEALGQWCYVVATRLSVDEYRRSQRLEVVGEVPDVAYEVDEQVFARAHLARVVCAFSKLSRTERAAILAAFHPADVSAPGREAVRRHRARTRLAALARIGGLVGALSALLRRPWARVLIGRPRLALVMMVASGAAVVLLAPFAFTPVPEINHQVVGRYYDASADQADQAEQTFVRNRDWTPAPVAQTSVSEAVDPPVIPPGPEAPRSAVPTSTVELPGPGPRGHNGKVTIRPKQPDDHWVCADTNIAGEQCVDGPQLPDPEPPILQLTAPA